MTENFSIEKHGDGYAFYLGRTNYYHGLNIFYITNLDEKLFLKIKPLLENSDKMAETLISLESKINQLDNKEKVAFLDELGIIAELKNKLNKD